MGTAWRPYLTREAAGSRTAPTATRGVHCGLCHTLSPSASNRDCVAEQRPEDELRHRDERLIERGLERHGFR
jgi:hypothetical protein